MATSGPRASTRAGLTALLGWAKRVDAPFFNDRTSIILGERPTVGAVKHRGGRIVPDPAFDTTGDGTVPDALALVAGVTRVYKAAGADHMMLPATYSVIAAVRDILAGRPPRVAPFGLAAKTGTPFPVLEEPPAVPAEAAEATPAKAKAKAEAKVVVTSPFSTESAKGGSVLASRMAGDVTPPDFRRLRVFSFDPLMATELDSLGTEQITLELPWDFADGNLLQPGPVGEYIEVIDCDPASGCVYPPIDLNHPHILAQDGIPVSEGDPRFHQQMVYAVAMNTIRQFEMALGRRALWSPRVYRDASGKAEPPPKGMPFEQQAEREYVQRLRIYPHAMREANAYYHPDKKALLFGYFPAEGQDGDRNLPGGTVFTCLSHDVVAHETTHALLDGMHRYFIEPSNPDVFAFHEAFADIVALFQHFSHKDVLWSELARARGDMSHQSKLGILAAQFGEATGHHGALRQYLGAKDPKTGVWGPIEPDPSAIQNVTEPHARGAIFVAALFRSFTNIYENRVRDLRRIATGGTGELPVGDLHPDLVNRMAGEATKAARHLLGMCIRALDYVPPIDVSFGDYLRAIVTADYDLVRDDDRHYRVSVLSAFREWGIYPRDVRSLSIDNLLWSEPSIDAHFDLRDFLDGIAGDAGWDMLGDRRRAFERMKWNSMKFHQWLGCKPIRQVESLGLAFDPKDDSRSIRRLNGQPVFEVHSFRPCRRIGPDGQQRTEFVVELVQKRKGYFDEKVQADVDSGKIDYDKAPPADFTFRGGSTLLVDPLQARIRYCIQKPACDNDRRDRERKFRLGESGDATDRRRLPRRRRPGQPVRLPPPLTRILETARALLSVLSISFRSERAGRGDIEDPYEIRPSGRRLITHPGASTRPHPRDADRPSPPGDRTMAKRAPASAKLKTKTKAAPARGGASGRKAAGGKAAPKPGPTAPRKAGAPPAKGSILVRMYRQGLGDCFLLQFPRKRRRQVGRPGRSPS